jgi:hypothetical protein
MSKVDSQELSPQEFAKKIGTDPGEADRLVASFIGKYSCVYTLKRLAFHYGVTVDSIQKMVIDRQVAQLHLLTDYDRTDREAALQKLLGEQNSRLDDLMTKATDMLAQLSAALDQTRCLRDEAARVLAAQQAELARLEKEPATTQPPA